MSDNQRTDPRILARPTPGKYRHRMVRRGPWVAAEISLADGIYSLWVCGRGITWRGSSEQLITEIEQALLAGRAFQHPMVRVSIFGQRISDELFHYLVDRREWALANAPTDPYAVAEAPINLDDIPPVF